MANMEIQICSFAKDFEWCKYALRSIAKYAKGFGGVTLVVPEADLGLFQGAWEGVQPPCPVRYVSYVPRPDKLKLHYLIQQCSADKMCPSADLILHMDSDCVFTEPVTPEDYMVNGRPVLLRERWERIHMYCPARCKWKPLVEKALRFKTEYETMVRHPSVHWKWLYPNVRGHIAKWHGSFVGYVFAQSETPLGFTEYPTLGAYALKFHADSYHWVDAKSPHGSYDMCKAPGVKEKMKQFWSHAGVDKHKEELEKIVS